MSNPSFKLSASLAGHTQDVRCVHAVTNNLILTSSRDSTVRAWGKSPDGQWSEQYIFENAHSGYVGAVNWLHTPSQDYVITAGSDYLVNVWEYPPTEPKPSPFRTLVGHSQNVCAISVGKSGRIVTGSWDMQAKIWRDFQEDHSLTDHEQAVWDVLALDPAEDNDLTEEITITAAADNIIRIYRGNKPTSPSAICKGHQEPVRALANLPDLPNGGGFASASNDGTIRVWNLQGQELTTLGMHDAYVYDLTRFPDGSLASGGEDRSVRIWNTSAELDQTLTFPALSIWSVSALPNGDLAVGSSDNMLRIFTKSSERLADETTQKQYDELLANSAINKTQVGSVKPEDISDPSVLQRPGTKEGKVVMVKNGTSVEAHQWDASAFEWKHIGVVVDSVGSKSKTTYEGKEYDYVFDVDVQEGAPPLKLPFNANENPYEAAQKFLAKHDLPMTYTDQVVAFIDKNTAGVSLTSSGNPDPYTGSGGPKPPSTTTTATTTPSSSTRLLPHRTPLTFTQTNLTALVSKLKVFNSQLSASGSALESSDLENLEQLADALSKKGQTKVLTPQRRSSLVTALQWPSENLLPIIDLLRMTVIYDVDEELVKASIKVLINSKSQQTNSMLILRAFANMANTQAGKSTLGSLSKELFDCLLKIKASDLNKNGKIAFGTVILNLGIMAIERDLDRQAADPLLTIITDSLTSNDDAEGIYRTLVGLGNLFLSPNVTGGSSSTTLKNAQNQASQVASKFGEDRMKNLVAEFQIK